MSDTKNKMHPAIREALAAQGVFLQMGILADHIFIKPTRRSTTVNPTDVADLAVVVQREAEYERYIGECSMSMTDFLEAWRAAGLWWNSASIEERLELIDSSQARLSAVTMIFEMTQLGFNMSPGKDA